MSVNIDGLTKSELEEFRSWVQQKRDHYESLLRKVNQQLNVELQPGLPLEAAQKKVLSPSDVGRFRTKQKIVQVMMDSGSWLSNSQILSLLKKKMGVDLSSNGLRAHLQKNEDKLFTRKGENRNTRWKVIRQNK